METITSTTMYKPSFHDHPLFFSARVVTTYCHCCGIQETSYGGYYCNDPNCSASFFHKKCAEAPLEINHPYHPQHPLVLINDKYRLCDLCGDIILFSYYNCSTCKFKVHLTCGMKLSPSTIKHPPCHDHPLAFLKKPEKESCCEVCMEGVWRLSYLCHECNIYFHLNCVNLSKEVNHPCHSNHPLKLIASEKLLDDAEKTCFLCKKQPKVIYHCSICNFSICTVCTRNPPPLVIEHRKTHIHPLTIFSKKISFTCDVCGEDGESGPYVCIQCAFLTHGECIDLPRVININRHEHQISFTHHLGTRHSKCGVCRKNLSMYHGAYSCTVCPKYAAHCRCAVRDDVWDFIELEGIPNHDTGYTAPFKVVGDDLIIHFSHEKHPLKLYKNKNLYDKWLQCEACIYPLGFESIYGCEECGFILHEKCANLSMKKKLIFSLPSYSLEVVDHFATECYQCRVLFNGFRYRADDMWRASIIDIHCGSLSEPFVHDGHLHPLYFDDASGSMCDACKDFVSSGYKMLRCEGCKFSLCLYCASLPLKICHKNDDHPITLHWGVKVSIEGWCDICEREVDQCKWFYTCSDCEVTFHTRCLLGDFSRLKPEKVIFYFIGRFEVVRNNNNTRPLCSQCDSRCKFLVVLKTCDGNNRYICSMSCLRSYFATI